MSKLQRHDTKARTPVTLPSETFSASAPPSKAETIVPGTPPFEHQDPEHEQPDLEDSAWAALDSEIVVPASSPPATPAKRRRSSLKGSEDLIVRDSDNDDDSVCSPRKPMFNLTRFTFTG